MGTELGGYREYLTKTADATTYTVNFDVVGHGHKVYVEMVGVKSDKSNSDCEVYLVTGGQQYLLRHFTNLTAGDGQAERVGAWLYESEHLRFYWQDVASADTVEQWAIGTDKWEKDST